MDLLGYAALGGLERLTIVAGAVIIGYWGYRLYTAEKSAGLIFMGLAVLILVGALATGGSYLKSVGEGYQLASLPAEAPADESPLAEPGAPEAADMPAAGSLPGSATAAAADPATDQAAVVEAPQTTASPEDAIAPGASAETTVADAAVAEAEASAPESDASPARLATGAELGGRIVSIKSENISLEWSADSEEPDSGSE